MNSNFERPRYISYKKVLLLGVKSTGKSSLSNRLEKGIFIENIEPKEEGKI